MFRPFAIIAVLGSLACTVHALAIPSTSAVDHLSTRARVSWCSMPGSACASRREEHDGAREVVAPVDNLALDANPSNFEQSSVEDHVSDNAGSTLTAREAYDPDVWFGFCDVPGNFCGEKREAVTADVNAANELPSADEGGELAARRIIFPNARVGFCDVPGNYCGE